MFGIILFCIWVRLNLQEFQNHIKIILGPLPPFFPLNISLLHEIGGTFDVERALICIGAPATPAALPRPYGGLRGPFPGCHAPHMRGPRRRLRFGVVACILAAVLAWGSPLRPSPTATTTVTASPPVRSDATQPPHRSQCLPAWG